MNDEIKTYIITEWQVGDMSPDIVLEIYCLPFKTLQEAKDHVEELNKGVGHSWTYYTLEGIKL